MELITSKEIAQTSFLKNIKGNYIARMIMSVFKIGDINTIYARNYQKPAGDFLKSVLNDLHVSYEVSETDIVKVPPKGPFIIVANHPYGGLEGIILLHALLKIRSDIKIMGNYLLQRIAPIKDYIIPVNPFEEASATHGNIAGLKACFEHLQHNNGLVIFPAGEVSTFQYDTKEISDRKWKKNIMKLIAKAKVPVVPVFFHGTNSAMFHWLGIIHPLLRTAKIPSELLNKQNKKIKLRIGKPISVAEQELFVGTNKLSRYLRAKTYALGSETDLKPFFKPFRLQRIENIIPPVPQEILCREIRRLPGNYELFRNQKFAIYSAPIIYIPNIIKEIGRLRELTFREVGEGTNTSCDLDEYDLYYWQLFIWDSENKAIVGGYRAGLGKEIMEQYGKKGFYTKSLFKMDDKLKPLLYESVELGRSFVVSEYQRKPMSLYLLWKGIMLFLQKHQEYRYLIGAVSITDRYSSVSKQLLVDFIRNNYFDQELSKFIKPKRAFAPVLNRIETNLLTEELLDINQLELLIKDIETPSTRIPVLLKKYLQMGGKIAAFNVDPAFNNSLDGFLVLDLAAIPKELINNLARKTDALSPAERFNY
ncbi:MAG TPA: lysophospholipid acyltransferase family protein [Bacteroidales bacterium]|nr:lysophospholipid acyltransferase family protein [Bacteroidales bacterium]